MHVGLTPRRSPVKLCIIVPRRGAAKLASRTDCSIDALAWPPLLSRTNLYLRDSMHYSVKPRPSTALRWRWRCCWWFCCWLRPDQVPHRPPRSQEPAGRAAATGFLSRSAAERADAAAPAALRPRRPAKDAPEEVLEPLHAELTADPTPEKVYSFAELAFVSAKRAEYKGDELKALDCYAASVAHAYLYLFSPNFDRFRNPYDPRVPPGVRSVQRRAGRRRCGWPRRAASCSRASRRSSPPASSNTTSTSSSAGRGMPKTSTAWSSSATTKSKAG